MNEEKVMAVEAEEVIVEMTKGQKIKGFVKKHAKKVGVAAGMAVAFGLGAIAKSRGQSDDYEGEYADNEVCDETENV